MSMTGTYGPTDPHEAAATALEALDSDVTMFDTGDLRRRSERQSPRPDPRTRRDRAVQATRTGVALPRAWCPPAHPHDPRRAGEDSLRRLRTDRIDLYYLARIDPAVSVQESVGALADLGTQGKDGHIGLLGDAVPDTGHRGPDTATKASP